MRIEEGQKFERYHIIRQLGQGSSGISYEAADNRLKSNIVLKLIQPWSETAYSVRRQFFRDMQVLSVLRHAHLVGILNYGEVTGQLYVARRYMSRGSLLGNTGRMLFNPPLTIQDAFAYAYQLAEVLHLIHSSEYVHGSLTFSNILLSEPETEAESPTLLLSDAWLAQFVRRFGQVQQHVHSMTAAPEQYVGQTVPASDQYALAVLLWVWLTGRPPFAGSPAEIERLKLAESIPPLNAGLTGEQESIIRRALRTKPDARYPSILAFAQALLSSLRPLQPERTKEEALEISRQQVSFEQAETIPQPVLDATAEEQEQPRPAEPLPQIEPDSPQLPPQPLPEPQPEPAEAPPPPAPEVDPVIIPTPAPDIAQPLPEQSPFPPAPEPVQSPPTPDPITKPASRALTSAYTQPLSHSTHRDTVPTAYLIITSSFPREPRKIPLLKEEINIGRAGSSDILLDEDTITSRHHAQINREKGDYVIYDKRSTYGVTINDQKLEDGIGQALHEGDRIQIGDYHLLFSFQLIENTNEARIEHALM